MLGVCLPRIIVQWDVEVAAAEKSGYNWLHAKIALADNQYIVSQRRLSCSCDEISTGRVYISEHSKIQRSDPKLDLTRKHHFHDLLSSCFLKFGLNIT